MCTPLLARRWSRNVSVSLIVICLICWQVKRAINYWCGFQLYIGGFGHYRRLHLQPGISRLMHGLALTDTWQGNPTHKLYTHYSASGATRIDQIYATRELFERKLCVEAIVAPFTDHLAVYLRISIDLPNYAEGTRAMENRQRCNNWERMHGEGKNYMGTNTRSRIAIILRMSPKYILPEWTVRPSFHFWSPQGYRAILWILAHVIYYCAQHWHQVATIDYADIMRRARWKAYQKLAGAKRLGITWR